MARFTTARRRAAAGALYRWYTSKHMTTIDELEQRLTEVEKTQEEGIGVLTFWIVLLFVAVSFSSDTDPSRG